MTDILMTLTEKLFFDGIAISETEIFEQLLAFIWLYS